MGDTALERLNVERSERPGAPHPPMFLHKMFIRWDLARIVTQDVDSMRDKAGNRPNVGTFKRLDVVIPPTPGGFRMSLKGKGLREKECGSY
jgi:NAD-dependent SIR2 family protein deacetylase